MAKVKAHKKNVGVELPECPVCLDPMSAPIFQCQSGHSLCSTCTSSLCPPICPICRQPMTQMRNWQLEEMISKAKISCPNKSEGCVYNMMSQEIEDHLKECIFREMACPLGAIFGKCSWNGKIKDMLQHFNERHPQNCNINTDSDIELEKVSIAEDDRHVFLVAQGKLLFIVNMKIDTIQKMAYWTIQHIGSKKTAQQHVYEIHVISKQDNRRKAMFYEYCFNDAIKPDDIFRQGKCGIMPLNMLNHFIKEKKLLFRIFIKRIPINPNQKFEKGQTASGAYVNRPFGKGHKGPGPQGPGPHGPRGPSPRSKSPGPFSGGPRGKFNNHPFKFQ